MVRTYNRKEFDYDEMYNRYGIKDHVLKPLNKILQNFVVECKHQHILNVTSLRCCAV